MTSDSRENALSAPVQTSRRRMLQSAALAAAAPFLDVRATQAQAINDASLVGLGAADAVAKIRQGEVTAEGYTAALIRQHNAHVALNGVIAFDEAKVMEAARAVDKHRAAGGKLGALAGLPFAVKDQVDVVGYETTGGNGAIRGYRPKQTAEVVQKMIDAGGIVFAKTNCSDMVGSGGLYVHGATSNNPWFGTPRNPYDPARTPGGSSGGSGTVLAARIVPAAIGEDSGGSVRCPAACCGVAGLRPSTYTPENIAAGTFRKRYSGHGMVPLANVVDTWGPMARTVSDVALLDTVITGERVPNISLKGARIGIPRADYWDQEYIDLGVKRVTEEAFAKLKDAGAQLVDIDLKALWALNEGARINVRLPIMSTEEWLKENVPNVTMMDVLARQAHWVCRPPTPPVASQAERAKILAQSARVYSDTFKTNGLIALAFPTLPMPAPLINVNGDTPGQRILINGRAVDELEALILNLFAGPRFGAPGLSLPSGLSDGLPVGLEFEGLAGDDSRILALGIAAERVLGYLPPPKF